MRVGIDLRASDPTFKAHQGRGIGRYVTKLLEALKQLGETQSDGGFEVIEATSERLRAGQRILSAVPIGRLTLESQLCLPWRLRGLEVDLMHFPIHTDAPVWSPVPRIVTVLDLIPLRFPALYAPQSRVSALSLARFRFARWLEHQAVRGAARVLTISDASKRDIVELLSVAEDRIDVTELGVDHMFCPAAEGKPRARAALQGEFGIPQDGHLLLYTGGIDPRKNVHFLIRLVAALVESSETPLYLAIVGRYDDDAGYQEFLRATAPLREQGRVFLLGRVSDPSLVMLYQAASLFVFPSLYEGFGLPALEAIASGTPVVAGNNSSLPMVVGGGGVLLPDMDLERWRVEITNLLGSESERLRLGEVGVSHAKRFSWEHTARATLAAYQRVCRPE